MNPCGWDMIGLSVKVIVFRVCLDESGTDAVICCRKVESRRKVEGAMRFCVHARGLKLEFVRVLYENLFCCMAVRQ